MSDESKTSQDEAQKRRFKAGKGGAVEVTEKRGLNRIPMWLTRDKGLPDWLAGSLVVVASGLLLSLLVLVLALIFPA